MKRAGRRSFRKARPNGAALFVYGTLRRSCRHPMHELLRSHADLVGAGIFQGKLYDLGHFPGAVASREASDRVHGEIYALSDPEGTLRALDEYEGAAFRREKVTVLSDYGKKIRCWIYLYRRPPGRTTVIASGDFLRHRG